MLNIYCDGSCSWRNRRGGFGVVIYRENKIIEEISEGAYFDTTISQMELLAMIISLQKIKEYNEESIIYSDSEYTTNMINQKWLKSWKEFEFVGKKNSDFLQLYFDLFYSFSKNFVQIIHIRGHKGIEGNEKADFLAKKGYNNLS